MKGLFGLLIIWFLGGFTQTLGESGTEVGARVPVNVAVPEQWRTPPFDRERVLTVPVGARISILPRVRGARFLAVSPNGDILVSQPSRGKILLIRQSQPSEAGVYELISGLRLPFRNGWDGDRTSDYGRLMRSYVDEHPPDEFIHVIEGANYGWPFANPDPDKGLDHMPFDPDYETNPGWSRVPERSFTRIDKGIPAHSAPLGFSST